MKIEKAFTPTKITGTGIYDNGQFPDTYNNTEKTEVRLSYAYGFTYVNCTVIVNNGIRKGMSQTKLENVTDAEILKAVATLIK